MSSKAVHRISNTEDVGNNNTSGSNHHHHHQFTSSKNARYQLFSSKIHHQLLEMFNFSHHSQKLINSYQKKITFFDKQQWERSLEDHIISRAENICSKSTGGSGGGQGGPTVNSNLDTTANSNDLIDLDLISGSAYRMKSKSQQGWLSLFVHAIIRVLFFPLYLRWWAERTSHSLAALLLLLYILQVTVIRMYYHKGITLSSFSNSFATTSAKSSPNEFSEVSPTEVLMPIAMMIILGVIHTQIVGTKTVSSSSSSSNSGYSAGGGSNYTSRKNSSPSYNSKSESVYPNAAHTECSSSPLSSSSSSVESSPVAEIKHRYQNSQSVEANDSDDEEVHKETKDPNVTIPKLELHDEHKRRDIILIDDHLSDEYNNSYLKFVTQTKKAKSQSDSASNRRYSDSKEVYIKYSNDGCRRRFSTPSNPKQPTQNKVTPGKITRFDSSNLRKRPVKNRFRKDLKLRKSNCTSCGNEDHTHSLSPLKLAYPNYYGSSFDSEGTISPLTPITSIQGDDWPMLNSDANTSEVDEEDNYFVFEKLSKKQHHLMKGIEKVCDSKPNKTRSAKMNYVDKGDNSSTPKTHYTTSSIKSQNSDFGTSATQQLESNNSNELKVSCSIWQHNVCQKEDLSVMDISSAIIRKVETIEHSAEYIILGVIFSITIGILPAIYRMQYLLTTNSSSTNTGTNSLSSSNNSFSPNILTSTADLIQLDLIGLFNLFLDDSLFFNKSFRVRFVVCVAMFERFILSLLYFFLLCVAERTFKQRFLYSKYFSQITRRDRAKRSHVPHFRLHKVRNLKVWLSVRSYLRRHGPHRSVDTICSTSFIIAICLLTCISLQMLKDSSDTYTSRLICWEMVFWTLALGLYIMRLMILGSRINQKYRSNLSVLITEQINLYLQLERKPHKKEALMLANHVLKLAVDLLKELESPYKISGFSANPYLYNITKVVVLSAFSAVLTEMLGFKLKLYKIKLIR